MAKKKRIEQDDSPQGLTHNPFAALRPGGAPAPPPPPPAEAATTPASGSDTGEARVVVRREKKGRAGKTVTRVSGLGLEPDALAELARDLKRALGCGATLEEEDVLLQGSLTERAAPWLEERLGRRVTRGN